MLDIGCTQHMTDNVKMFTSLEDDVGYHDKITIGYNSKANVVGLGKIAISNDLSICNILLVESLSFNLLSVAQLCDLGFTCLFSDADVIITSKKHNDLIFKGFRHGCWFERCCI